MTYLHISAKQKPQVVRVQDGQASYTTPFYKGWALNGFKAVVPWDARRWDAETKTWTVKVKFLDALKALADAYGPVQVEEVTE